MGADRLLLPHHRGHQPLAVSAPRRLGAAGGGGGLPRARASRRCRRRRRPAPACHCRTPTHLTAAAAAGVAWPCPPPPQLFHQRLILEVWRQGAGAGGLPRQPPGAPRSSLNRPMWQPAPATAALGELCSGMRPSRSPAGHAHISVRLERDLFGGPGGLDGAVRLAHVTARQQRETGASRQDPPPPPRPHTLGRPLPNTPPPPCSWWP